MDEKHSPRLWARFLEGLLATPMAKVDLSPSTLKNANGIARRTSRRTTCGQRPSQGSSGRTAVNSSPSSGFGQQVATSPQLDDGTSPASVTTLLSSPNSVLLPAVTEEHHGQGTFRSPETSMLQHQQSLQNQHLLDQQQQLQNNAHASNPQQHHQVAMSPTNLSFDSTAFQAPQQQPYQGALQMNMSGSEYFQGPLPFIDSDMIQVMQSMPDTSVWQNNNMAGKFSQPLLRFLCCSWDPSR